MIKDIVIPLVTALIGAFGLHVYKNTNFLGGDDPLSGEWIGIGREVVDSMSNQREFTENLDLSYVRGTITGEVEGDNQSWEQIGFLRDGYITLAYRTIGEQAQGIGTYFLRDQDGKGQTYVGYWEGKDCTLNRVVRCPYILRTTESVMQYCRRVYLSLVHNAPNKVNSLGRQKAPLRSAFCLR
jgi:hypothetical protein